MALINTIQLLRGGKVISSLAGAFCSSLKETRLTALLGYVVALHPEAFRRAFGFTGAVSSVSLEEYTDAPQSGRTDIRLYTSHGECVVEAKVSFVDPWKQSTRYPAKWRVLLTNHIPTAKQQKLKGCRYIRWSDIGDILKSLGKSKDPVLRFVSNDLVRYLEEYNMIKKERAVEIYAREINGPESLKLFLEGRIYRCQFQMNSKLPEALYFAPHFGKSLENRYPGIQSGISYVSRIETVEVVESIVEFRDAVKTVRGKSWYNRNKEMINRIRWVKKDKRLSVVFVGVPRLVFNPPVKKTKLQKGSGWLSKYFLSFDELFEAWAK